MIKGWRLNPLWVEHYAKRDKARLERQLQRAQIEVRQEMLNIDMERAIKRLTRQPRYQP